VARDGAHLSRTGDTPPAASSRGESKALQYQKMTHALNGMHPAQRVRG
jgi:hypothetical protein